jgi:hypothetical protein
MLRHFAVWLRRLLNKAQTRHRSQHGLELEHQQETGEERPHQAEQ